MMEQIKNYFSKQEWILFTIIILVGVILRWYNIDIRPVHHDESLHAIYSKYYYINPTTQYYKYNPMLHGPFLYHLVPIFYHIIDFSKFAFRSPMAILGCLFIFIPFTLRRFLSARTVLITTCFISLSPTLIYWSRFLRHDYFVLFCFFTIIISVLSSWKYRYSIIITAFSLWMCIKENYFLFVPIVLGFYIYQYLLIKKKPALKLSFKYYLPGLLAGAYIFCYYYSAGFQYQKGILDGLFYKGLPYWLNQHKVERISGPFAFNFFILSWYELIFILTLALHTGLFYLKDVPRKYLIAPISSLVLAGICYIWSFPRELLANFFKLKITLDFYLFFFLITHALSVTTYYLKEKKFEMAFWGYFFFANFFSYSYAGEKVPWLAMYPFIAGLFFFALYFKERINNLRPGYFYTLIILITSFNFYISYLTNHKNAGSFNELISQVHTTNTYEDLVLNRIIPNNHSALNLKDNTWPLSWYMHGTNRYSFTLRVGDSKVPNYDYVFTSTQDLKTTKQLEKTHTRKVIPLRHWWVPDYKKMGLKEFFKYSIDHIPWNPTGYQNIAVFIKKSIEQ